MNKALSTLCLKSLLAASLCSSLTALAADTLTSIKEKQSVTIAYREETFPFSYLAGDKKPVGYSIDICMLLVESLKRELKLPKMNVNYLAVNAENRLKAIADGKADLECGSSTNNQERRNLVNFAIPHFFANVRMLVRNDTAIKNWPDIKGKTLVLTTGSSTAKVLAEKAKTKDLKYTVVNAANHQASFALLENSKADAFVMDDVLLYALRAESKKPKTFIITGDVLSTQTYSIVLRKDDPNFKKFVDKELANEMINGTVGKIYGKWFKQATPPKSINLEMPMNHLLTDQFRFPTDQHLE
ncbi:amino acid ABC transporter substrate-binding protein [Undibacterium sp. Ren11W]|uniref:amino acid ABC transporter substrate-binding protein n=1 Tax=Undibacterium sp. Ren11W TaxID=3413045 RepID=UPI003BF35AA9